MLACTLGGMCSVSVKSTFGPGGSEVAMLNRHVINAAEAAQRAHEYAMECDIEDFTEALHERLACLRALDVAKHYLDLPTVYERKRECMSCGWAWSSDVELDEHTFNLSGESTTWCPKCDSRAGVSYPQTVKE